ncbi:MAG: 3-isopropylmalate dehydratase [Candidatus Methylacidiphilales bacterium]|nr:3-isopropylmalate dehydratase [Candidatus Methylacidiphilales bacterium]
MASIISGPAYVVQNNIDTDQIIPAQYLQLIPTIPEEYDKLGSYAMIGLPESLYPERYIDSGEMKTKYKILIASRNFGCGSSREHAPIALGASGCEVVVAESYARIFFRNCIATGEVYPYELSDAGLSSVVKTGDYVEVDFEKDEIRTPHGTFKLNPLGEVKPVIDAGGIFNFAREAGLIPAA